MKNRAPREKFNCYFTGPFSSTRKSFISVGGWALGYHSMKLRHFPYIS